MEDKFQKSRRGEEELYHNQKVVWNQKYKKAMQEFARGDTRDKLRAVFKRHHTYLVDYCKKELKKERISMDNDTAEDIIQDMYIDILEKNYPIDLSNDETIKESLGKALSFAIYNFKQSIGG